jgi:hypothetical protein
VESSTRTIQRLRTELQITLQGIVLLVTTSRVGEVTQEEALKYVDVAAIARFIAPDRAGVQV